MAAQSCTLLPLMETLKCASKFTYEVFERMKFFCFFFQHNAGKRYAVTVTRLRETRMEAFRGEGERVVEKRSRGNLSVRSSSADCTVKVLQRF